MHSETTATTQCALFGTPLESAYRNYGLDLSLQGIEGPHNDQYHNGLHVSVHTTEQTSQTVDSSHTYYIHTVHVRGSWSMPKATFSKEGLIDRIGKFFGRKELQGGDPIFDDNIFIEGDTQNTHLAAFVSNDHVQSALLALVLGDMSGEVELSRNMLSCRVLTQDTPIIDYKAAVLPMLALAVWAQRIAP